MCIWGNWAWCRREWWDGCRGDRTGAWLPKQCFLDAWKPVKNICFSRNGTKFQQNLTTRIITHGKGHRGFSSQTDPSSGSVEPSGGESSLHLQSTLTCSEKPVVRLKPSCTSTSQKMIQTLQMLLPEKETLYNWAKKHGKINQTGNSYNLQKKEKIRFPFAFS